MLIILTISIFLTVYVEVFALILLPIYIIVTKQQFIFLRRKEDLIFLCAFWVLSMVVTVIYGGTTIDYLIGIFMIFAFIAMIFITYTMTQRTFRVILSLCCIMSVPCFFVACIQKWMGLTWSYGARYSSVFSNPNYYAFFIAIVLLFCIYNIIKSERKSSKIAYAILIPVNIVALFMTECRTTFVVVILTCPIMLGFLPKKRWLYIYLGILASALLAGLFFGDSITWLPRMDSIFEDLSKRFSIWSGAIDSIKDAPVFGRGYNTYVRINNLYGSYSADHAHNLILELLMNFGIVGSLVLFTYFFINVNKIIHLHRQNKCHMRYALTVSVIVSVILHGLLDITMLWPQTGLLLMYVVGFSTEYDKKHIFSESRSHNIINPHPIKNRHLADREYQEFIEKQTQACSDVTKDQK